MNWYRTGTISGDNGSNFVTGIGTDFIGGAAVGEAVQMPDGKPYEIQSIVAASGVGAIVLASPYLGANFTAQAYAIIPTQSYIRDLAAQAASLVNGFAATRDGAGAGRFPDGTQTVPGIRFVADDNTGIRRIGADNVGLVVAGVDQATLNATGFIARVLQLWNAAGTFKNAFANATTAIRTWTFPDKSGTVAMTSDITGGTTAGSFTTLSASGLLAAGAISGTEGTFSSIVQRNINPNSEFDTESRGFTSGYNGGGNAGLWFYNTFNNNNLINTRIKATSATGVTSTIGDFSSTGLAVTGALSATGNIDLNAGQSVSFSGTGQGAFSNPADAGSVRVSAGSTAGYVSKIVAYGGGSATPNKIVFTTASNDVMTLDASGAFTLGSGGFSTGADFSAPGAGAVALSIGHHVSAVSGNPYHYFTFGGSVIGTISQSGTTAVAYNTTSDHRLKENVRPANAARFMDIEFVDFEWIDGRHDCGVIAGQLQTVYPELVLGEVDATEVRQVEITPAIPAVTEQREVSPAVPAEYTTVTSDEIVLIDGVETTITRSRIVETKAAIAAVSETVEVTPAIPAVTEDQTFPVYQQVNYAGLIGRMGTRVQQLQRTVDAQAALIESLTSRLTVLEAK